MIRSFSVSMNNIKEKSAACHRTIHLFLNNLDKSYEKNPLLGKPNHFI